MSSSVSLNGPSNGEVVEKELTSSTLAHLKAYPIVSDILTLLQRYTVYNYIIAYSTSAKQFTTPYILKTPLLKTNLLKLDSVLDNSVLTKFDQSFPQITKIQLQDLAPSSVFESLKLKLYSTINSTTESLVERAHTVEEKTRPTIAKKVNPFVSPVNDKFESLIKTYLPEDAVASSIPSLTSKDELERFYNLSVSAYTKTLPILSSTKDQVKQIPNHISDVYKEEKASSKTASDAIRNTSRKLSFELIDTLKPIVNPILTKVETLRTSTQTKINLAIDTTKNNIDELVSEVKKGVDDGTLNNSSASAAPSVPVVAASA